MMSRNNITLLWAILRKMRLHDYTSVYITGDLAHGAKLNIFNTPLKPIGHCMYHQFNIPNSTFSQLCSVWMSQQTAIISLYSIIWLVFYNQDSVCLLCGTDWNCIHNSG